MAAISMDGNALRDETVAGLAIRIADLGSPEICLATGPRRRRRSVAAPTSTQSTRRRLRLAWCPAIASFRLLPPQQEVEAIVRELAADPTVHGILVQLPLPSGLDPEPVLDLVPAEKDVDGLTERSMGRLVRGRPGLVSCTPLGVMRLLEKYEIRRVASVPW